MTPNDADLLERLCVAGFGGCLADSACDPETCDWDAAVVQPARVTLSAIRAAEGQSEPVQRCAACKWFAIQPGDRPCIDCDPDYSKWEPKPERVIVGCPPRHGKRAAQAAFAREWDTSEVADLRAKLAAAEQFGRERDAMAVELAGQLAYAEEDVTARKESHRCAIGRALQDRAQLRAQAQQARVDYRQNLDAAEAIIHALVDERAKWREWHRDLVAREEEACKILGIDRHWSLVEEAPRIKARLDAVGLDDPDGAKEEQELLPQEWRMLCKLRNSFDMAPNTAKEATLLRWLARLGYAAKHWSAERGCSLWQATSLGCVKVDTAQEPAKPAPRVLKAGTVPERLMVGMAVQHDSFMCNSPCLVTDVRHGTAYDQNGVKWCEMRHGGDSQYQLTLAEDFTLPEGCDGE